METAQIEQLITKISKSKGQKRKGFERVLKGIMRIVDSAAGVVLGLAGGAIVGASEGMSHGVKAGAVSLANDPWTVSYDYEKQRGYTQFGRDAHDETPSEQAKAEE